MKSNLLTLGGLLTLPMAFRPNYNGYRVYRLDTGHEDASEFVKKQLNGFNYDIHDSDSLGNLSVAIAPDNLTAFESLGLSASVLHEDLGADIEAESSTGELTYKDQEPKLHPCFENQPSWFKNWFDGYHEFYVHLDYWDALLSCFPVNSENTKVGETTESRDIRAIHLFARPRGSSRPLPYALYFHANAYGRDWLATAVAEYFMFRLINGYLNGDKDARSMLDQYDFYIVPVVNPDGFVYSMQHDRGWKKNRKRLTASSCAGTNINRNWYFSWAPPKGSTENFCSPEFRGYGPGDTKEVAYLNDFTHDIIGTPKVQAIKLFIDWQSGGQRVLWPFHHVGGLYDDWEKAEESKIMAEGYKEALTRSCTYKCEPWEAGRAAKLLGAQPGTSLDYMAHQAINYIAKLEYALTIQIRSKNGKYVVEKEAVRPCGEEQYQAVKWFLLDRDKNATGHN